VCACVRVCVCVTDAAVITFDHRDPRPDEMNLRASPMNRLHRIHNYISIFGYANLG